MLVILVAISINAAAAASTVTSALSLCRHLVPNGLTGLQTNGSRLSSA